MYLLSLAVGNICFNCSNKQQTRAIILVRMRKIKYFWTKSFAITLITDDNLRLTRYRLGKTKIGDTEPRASGATSDVFAAPSGNKTAAECDTRRRRARRRARRLSLSPICINLTSSNLLRRNFLSADRPSVARWLRMSAGREGTSPSAPPPPRQKKKRRRRSPLWVTLEAFPINR